ncbi:MAG: EAL domain-containing protein [Methylococcales bacterium]|nr:EAL domain-containing protein [Methylococcales bacterium]
MHTLLHELNVHQIELEMQNAQLQQNQQALAESRNAFQELFEQAPLGYLRLDGQGRILQLNRWSLALLKRTIPEVLNQLFSLFVYQPDLTIWHGRYAAFFKKPEGKTLELRLLDSEKRTVEVALTGRLLHSADARQHPSLLVAMMDMTEQKRMAQELQLAATVFEYSQQGIMITDAERTILKVNPAFTAVTGYKSADVIGQNPTILSSGRQNTFFYQSLWNDVDKRGHWQGEIWNRRKDGDIYAEWLNISRVDDQYGRTQFYIGIFSDITEHKQHQKQIEHLAYYDQLTGLPNRTLFQDRLKLSITQAMRNQQWLVVFFIDLDRFKILNDTLGHFCGDLLLEAVAKILTQCTRTSDTVARFGGDEFAILLTGFTDQHNALQGSQTIALKIIDALQAPFDLAGNPFSTSASLGYALYPEDGDSVEALIKNADAAMYQAKAMGRNTCQHFAPEHRQASMQRNLLESQLRDAINQQQLRVYYQPMVDLKADAEIVGFEALIRWQHPEQGLIPPDLFIPIAEESGLILSIGEWVLQQALLQFLNWRQQGRTHLKKICVNLSARQFQKPGLAAFIDTTLSALKLPGSCLEVEITETMMMANMNQVIDVLLELKALGVKVALDDFGTGYSSLTYLKRFPIDTIKVDRSFVRDILVDDDDKIIVDSVIAIAQQMHLEIVAEGIEDAAQAQYLRAAGCQLGQGYFYNKPMPAKYFFQD